MDLFTYPFQFEEEDHSQITGNLILEKPLSYQDNPQESGFYRPGKITLGEGINLDVVFYHNPATAAFMYLQHQQVDTNAFQIIGLTEQEIKTLDTITLPGQLCMGANRANLIGQAMHRLFAAPPLKESLKEYQQHNIAVFPIAREGLKYQVSEAIFSNYDYYCDEIVLDAHHVFDSSVPVYNRKVEMTLFKDKDLDQHQHENITVAFIADSIASGLVMRETITEIKKRFKNLERVEVIAPLATIRGLSRIADTECRNGVKVRVHIFETILNALPPDYYYSAHFNLPEMHIRPDLEEAYRAWWGKDKKGLMIADTACAGYGWSEVFYSPRKQIEMINGELQQRHDLKLMDIIRRNSFNDSNPL
ncbi:MAG: hypothetical protein CL609_09990 [Anaerolineaceae bacterium]|nr:hypothetical protein [Anaerolineaceae bacterium]